MEAAGRRRREASYLHREPFDDEDRLRTRRQRPSHEVEEEECAGGLLLMLLHPDGRQEEGFSIKINVCV